MHRSFRAGVSVVVALSLGAAAVGLAATDPIHDRVAAMKGVGDSMKALAAIAKKQAPFDAAVVKKNAATISTNLKTASGLFPEGSGVGDTHAKPEVWTAPADFAKGFKDAIAAADALQSVDEAGFGAALGTLGTSCKNCHDKYRLSSH